MKAAIGKGVSRLEVLNDSNILMDWVNSSCQISNLALNIIIKGSNSIYQISNLALNLIVENLKKPPMPTFTRNPIQNNIYFQKKLFYL